MKDARAIIAELKKFSPLSPARALAVLNKIDLLPVAPKERRCREIIRRLRWKGPVYTISGVTRQGTRELTEALMRRLDELPADGGLRL